MKISKVLSYCRNDSIAELLKRILDRPDIILITSSSKVETMHTVRKGGVDAVLIECSGNEEEVIDILDEAASKEPSPITIVLGSRVDRESAIEMVEHGCSYVMENMMELHSIDKLLRSMLDEKTGPQRTERNSGETIRIIRNLEMDKELKLSRRELEILYHLIQGKQNKSISKQLGISEKTVKNHLWKIYKKFGVENRTELFNILIQNCGCLQLVSSRN